tara:strand:+ start:181 stop:546 length:366 start_codon:yes stop_codon:yes gene_type:complete
MKLKTLLLEYDDKVASYSDELGGYLHNLRPTIGTGAFKLKFTIERMTGTWAWSNRFIEIYATLGWEGKKEVPIEIGYNEKGNDGTVVKTIKYKPTFDLKKDAKWYISNMKRYLPGIVKDYE